MAEHLILVQGIFVRIGVGQQYNFIRGVSSSGRTSALQAGGGEFESHTLHIINKLHAPVGELVKPSPFLGE